MLKAPESLAAPAAATKPYSATHHGKSFDDPYFWLKDPGYPEVKDEEILGYLKEENAYFEQVMEPEKALTDKLFEEIKGRIKEDDVGVPWQEGKYDYRWAFAEGTQYRIWYYRPRTENPFEGEGWQVLLDENAEAEGKEFYKLGSLAVSPDGKYLAYSADDNGSERFTAKVRNLETGEDLGDSIEETSGEIVWDSASTSFAYVKVSAEWRPYLVNRHTLGAAEDQKIFEEENTSFFVHIRATSSDQYLIIRSADHVTAENHMVPLDDLSKVPECFAARRDGHDYYVDHGGQALYVRSNKGHRNFCVYEVQAGGISEDHWIPVIEGSDTRYLHGMQVFDGFLALQDRLDGLDQIYIWRGGKGSYVEFPEPVYEVGLGGNAEAAQKFVRLAYSSMTTPPTVYDWDIETGALTVRKEQEIPSGYTKENYASERKMITARDGTQIPVSIVYHKDWKKGSGAPLHLYGYGAYGLGMSPSFSSARLSLLDRGFAYAIAHIRGGDELGYGWYEAGKLERRTNTFNDFVDVARALTDEGYCAEGGISISGGSAGGELMGAVVNQAPELFAGCVMHVPFVDVLNTMLDADLPLTPIEWPEWGNPIESAEAYDTIADYCPYSNVEAKDYPPMMVTGGLNDPRVTYWEPAKWTAKMRATKTDDNLLVMKINMGAGHGGKSGRFERLWEVAEEYTFVLKAFGLNKEK
ncbi:S9 family peptidase [Kordiimonas sp. SCSIO 12603]|uniref:S9 family peptidase n=1 Tax=Kordiimonas sp. SCSIO 12603 TaxID=2829596 RepID=UPI0021080E80|nr:S9 family peptidase [Kordiimonas sp. SCSIO 12603]UTW59356.1 S9 family peptidase [Kordiimonas sp. SCSIO 12603]